MAGFSKADAHGKGLPETTTFKIETLDAAIGKPRRQLSVPISVALHAVAVVALIAVPAMMTADLPEAHAATHAFFVEPAAAVPPPPPPPAPRAVARHPEKPRPEPVAAFVVPIETPSHTPDQGLDLGIDNGVPGGVEGGVEGGVVGGIVGGLPSAPPPPAAPLRVGVEVREPRKIKNVPPEYPDLAQRARVSGVVILEAVIGPDGHVQETTVLRGVPMLDSAAVAAVRQWVYTPTLLRGVPVPVVMTVTVTFNLR